MAVFEYVSRELRSEIGQFVESIWFARGHIIRDFKRHAGVTPSEYVAAQRSTYEPDVAAESAGFVPERM